MNWEEIEDWLRTLDPKDGHVCTRFDYIFVWGEGPGPSFKVCVECGESTTAGDKQ